MYNIDASLIALVAGCQLKYLRELNSAFRALFAPMLGSRGGFIPLYCQAARLLCPCVPSFHVLQVFHVLHVFHAASFPI